MRYLNFELSESGHGVTTLEAMAATAPDQHAAVMAEVQEVLDWAWQHFPHSHGPLDDGNDWQHELQLGVETTAGQAGQTTTWHSVALTLSGSDAFVGEFLSAFDAFPD